LTRIDKDGPCQKAISIEANTSWLWTESDPVQGVF
jgi:hypothetical protein